MSNVEKESLSGPVTRNGMREDSDIDTFVFVKKGTRDEFIPSSFLDLDVVDIAADTDMEEGEYKIYLASL